MCVWSVSSTSCVDVADRYHATAVLVAVPSADSSFIRRVDELAAECRLELFVLPPVENLMGAVGLADIRPVSHADLLGRHPAEIDPEAIAGYISGRRVLVTGAGGSIGSELCRQIVRFEPAALLMLDRDENGLHSTQLSIEGRAMLENPNMIVADIRDAARLDEVFSQHRPEIVFHAAALKHLPLLESHPSEGWKTNVCGTLNLLDAAERHDVERFVNVSTDKAANPTSVLGWTKRITERLTAHTARTTDINCVSVRFGNVLGSNGSVLKSFEAQSANGGPLTVTHPDITRYFMTIEEASRLIVHAGAIGEPGEVMILDMGEPVKILDVAQRFADQHTPPLGIVFTGLRRNEKLHEDLISAAELGVVKSHDLITHVDVPPLAADQFDVRRRGVADRRDAGDRRDRLRARPVLTVRRSPARSAVAGNLRRGAQSVLSIRLDHRDPCRARPHLPQLARRRRRRAPGVVAGVRQRLGGAGGARARCVRGRAGGVHRVARARWRSPAARRRCIWRCWCWACEPGDEVYVSSFTFAASANAVVYTGARPRFIDSDTSSWNMSPALLADELTAAAFEGRLPKAVVVVDLYGQCADYDEIVTICDGYGIPVIEDAAEAVGATYRGRPAGTLGAIGLFSFNGNKIMTTSGGGALLSPDLDTADRVRYLATQARQPTVHYEHTDVGFNYRLSNLLAAIGRAQLARIPAMSARRLAINGFYRERLADLAGLAFMPIAPWGGWNGWLTCVTFDDPAVRDAVQAELEAAEIESRPLWKPMHLQPVFADAPARVDGTSQHLFEHGLCLPSGSVLTDAQVERVAALAAA